MYISKERRSKPAFRWTVTTLHLLVVFYKLSVRFSRQDLGVEIKRLAQGVLAEEKICGPEETLAYRCAIDFDSGTGMPDFRSKEERLVSMFHFGSDTETMVLTIEEAEAYLGNCHFYAGDHSK